MDLYHVGVSKEKRVGRQASKEDSPGFQDRSEWREFLRWNEWGVARRMNPLTLTRCHSYMKLVKDGSLSVAESTT